MAGVAASGLLLISFQMHRSELLKAPITQWRPSLSCELKRIS
jgi:hypothetical protein